MKEEYLDFIKNFSKISITSVCKKADVNRSNLLNGTASIDKTIKVKQVIEEEVAKLYLQKGEDFKQELLSYLKGDNK